MIVSPYTLLYQISNTYYVYNTLYKCVLGLNEEIYKILLDAKSHSSQLAFNNDILEYLYDKGIVVNSKNEAIQNCHDYIIYNRHRSDFKHLTIVPTLDCCFSCFYCFEKNRGKKYMSNETVNDIVSLVANESTLRDLHITWFGGEPLLAKEIIKSIYTKIRYTYNGGYSSDIITNGFYLDKEAAKFLLECEIFDVQISLDGLKSHHNKIKHISTEEDVYEKILNNIKYVLLNFPMIHINIRVNFGKNEIQNFVNTYKMLLKKFGGIKLYNLSRFSC